MDHFHLLLVLHLGDHDGVKETCDGRQRIQVFLLETWGERVDSDTSSNCQNKNTARMPTWPNWFLNLALFVFSFQSKEATNVVPNKTDQHQNANTQLPSFQSSQTLQTWNSIIQSKLLRQSKYKPLSSSKIDVFETTRYQPTCLRLLRESHSVLKIQYNSVQIKCRSWVC